AQLHGTAGRVRTGGVAAAAADHRACVLSLPGSGPTPPPARTAGPPSLWRDPNWSTRTPESGLAGWTYAALPRASNGNFAPGRPNKLLHRQGRLAEATVTVVTIVPGRPQRPTASWRAHRRRVPTTHDAASTPAARIRF